MTLPELTDLRRSLVSWVAAAAAGLDENGIAALVANVLGDFRERRPAGDGHDVAGPEAEGVA